MNAAFTGNSRRPRQVNLSGRAPNPWAKVSGSPSQPAASAQNAVADAQAARLRRAQDRARSDAAHKIQRAWRGHAARTKQKEEWRGEWDHNEQSRIQSPLSIPYQATQALKEAVPYETEEQLRYQMRLLLRFLDIHDAMDRYRLCYFGTLLASSWTLTEDPALALIWFRDASHLSVVVARALLTSDESQQRRSLLQLGILILRNPIKLDYNTQFRGLARVSLVDRVPNADKISEYVQLLLLRKDTQAYDGFVRHILSAMSVEWLPQIHSFLSIHHHQIACCESIRRLVPDLTSNASLWVLANTIHLWRSLDSGDNALGWISALSASLTRCANQVAEETDPMAISSMSTWDEFVVAQVKSLPLQESVQSVMKQFQVATTSISEVATPLANYAVALLRAFPSKATNIRMWLYQSSPAAQAGLLRSERSTIQYLWKATKQTKIFKVIQSDQNKVISVLTEARPRSNQFNHQPPSQAETITWEEEWRIVLLFMELYTFILKLMDDEEFFSLDDDSHFTPGLSYQFRQGALPLQDIAIMGDFLKNLAFSLIWDADQLAEYNEVEEATISNIFGNAPIPKSPDTHRPAVPSAKTLAGNDVSQAYMKGLATGLLRMLYERDSRRHFLPDDYWLMTRHFDMQSFIGYVVSEEERRHNAGEDLDDEEDLFDVDEQDKDPPDEMSTVSLGSLFNIRAPHMPRTQSSRQAEQLAKQRELARKRRQLQSLQPRLELLRNLPFFIPFETRVQIFRTFVSHDQQRRRNGYVDPDDWRMSVAATQARELGGGRPGGMDRIGRHHAAIRRGRVLEDAMDAFWGLGEELKEPIQISFIDQWGQPEAGIDGGGVTKEFLMSVTSEAFDPENSKKWFEENEQRFLYPRPTMWEEVKSYLELNGHRPGSEEYNVVLRQVAQHYEFIGRIIGKCMYEGILIDVNFAGFFLLKWALTGGTTSATSETAYRASINDLRGYDDQLYNGLLKLKNYPGDVEADFGLNFAVTDTFAVEVAGTSRQISVTRNLMANGANEPVTNANRLKYINDIVRYRLQEQPRYVTNAFLRGLGQIISPMWLAMFNQNELQKVVGGDNQELDIQDLRRNTQYGGLYAIGDDGLDHPTVALFWKVLKEMSDENRRKVLKFVTSTPRAPLLGFGHLNPKFSIRDSSEDQTRLPSTSTCVNLLKLPRYADERTMREKLLYAANSGAGFDLS